MWLNSLSVSEFSSSNCPSESITWCFVIAHVSWQKTSVVCGSALVNRSPDCSVHPRFLIRECKLISFSYFLSHLKHRKFLTLHCIDCRTSTLYCLHTNYRHQDYGFMAMALSHDFFEALEAQIRSFIYLFIYWERERERERDRDA